VLHLRYFIAIALIPWMTVCASGSVRHGRFDALCSDLDAKQILVPIRRVAPRYPPTAIADVPREAWVDVQFSIDDDGDTTNPHVVLSVPPGRYDHFALDALREWRFCPPREVRLSYPPVLTTRICFLPYILDCAVCEECTIREMISPWSKPTY